MSIFGIDFTSAPRSSKPITCAICDLVGDQLVVDELQCWSSFAAFESFLKRPGPWTAAIDFPFGQPHRLVQALGWPKNWSKYVELVASMTKPEFVALIDQYREQQPAGDKHHLRATDERAGSCSPMMLYGVPVGKMFFEGAPRLLRSGASILPCRPNTSQRFAIEGYPALVAQCLVGITRYKSEKSDASSAAQARDTIIRRCQSGPLKAAYGVSLQISRELKEQLYADAKGDLLDAVLCAIQAAAFEVSHNGSRARVAAADPVEGWIADPTYAV